MSDDFGTVNVKRGDRAREIEVLRQHYREHRETLNRLAAGAPSEHLANEYARLVQDINASLAKLDELEGRFPEAPSRAATAGAAAATGAAAAAAARPHRETPPVGTQPGTRPLVPSPGVDVNEDTYSAAPSLRLPIILLIGVVVLAILGYLIWRASSDKRTPPLSTIETTAPVTPVTETETGTVTPVGETATVAPQPASAITIAPAAADYGTIRKGTRAARQFEVVNKAKTPVQIQVARSQCRCLFYEYNSRIDPGKKDTITVTVDGARAKAGTLQETIVVTSKADPTVKASFDVQAVIK